MNQSNRARKPLAEAERLLREANSAIDKADAIFSWIDPDTHNMVFGSLAEYEAFLASR